MISAKSKVVSLSNNYWFRLYMYMTTNNHNQPDEFAGYASYKPKNEGCYELLLRNISISQADL